MEQEKLNNQLNEMESLMEKLFKETGTNNIEDLLKYYSKLEE